MPSKKELSALDKKKLLDVLKARFEKNIGFHKGVDWSKVQAKLEKNSDKLWSLNEMEKTGGEPDVVAFDKKTNEYIFYDCCIESPAGRRSYCYDKAALDARKENKPKNNAVDVATAMGVELLSEEEYMQLQKLASFDTKTSSWIKTTSEVRKLGGALYCDKRYNRIFVSHNGADSYYAARGFRCVLKV